MKKVLSFILCIALALTCVMAVNAEEETVAEYSFGEVEGEVAPGEVITLPVYLTVDIDIDAVTFQMSFDDQAFEFQPYTSSTGKGDHNLGLGVMDVTTADSSVIGAGFLTISAGNVSTFNDTLLCNVLFKISESAKAGEYQFEIIASSVSNDTGDTAIRSEKFEGEPLTVTIGETTQENPDEGNENPDEGDENSGNGSGSSGNGGGSSGNGGGNSGNGSSNGGSSEKDDEETGENTDEKTEENTTGNTAGENPESAAPEFSDLGGYEWATDYIMPLARQGIIRGTSETTFAPGNNITRADFMVLLMRLLELEGASEEGFEDVPPEAYFANAVANAKELGIAKGSEGKFNPYNSITREDMCVLVYRALNSMAYLPVLPDDGGFETKYSDISQISDYALDAMRDLSANGIIGGSDGKVNPRGYATRAETAVIMYRIQQLIPEF